MIDLELESARKKKAVKTFLGIARKRSKYLPCQMQKDIAQLIARQAYAIVYKSKRPVTEQINDIGDLDIRAKWLAYVNEQMNSVNN